MLGVAHPPERQLEMYGEHGRFAYHYTTREAAFEHVIPTKRFRLSSLAALRDPVENKDWVQQLWTSASWPERDVRRFRDLARPVTTETKILSFTLDAPQAERSPEHSRGYARPRMWEQYAENHAGVCLVFDRQSLTESLMEALPVFNVAMSSEVTYSDLPLPGHTAARSLNAASLTQSGDGNIEEGLRNHLMEHTDELFFRKLEDWVSERELRFLLLDQDAYTTYVPYGSALRGVIVGERFAEWQLPGAADVCRMAGVDLRQIQWGAFPPGVLDPTAPPPVAR